MLEFVLKLFGYRVVYTCEWGQFEYRYDALDRAMCRPIHPDMTVAPPWARRIIVKQESR